MTTISQAARDAATPLGRTIIELRAEQKITLSCLAEASGLGKGLLSKIETHPNPNPCYNTLRKIAGGLHMSMSAFLSELQLRER